MKHHLTREELLRRAAFGAALATIPGFAAACGGGDDGGGDKAASELKTVLNFENWPYYMDTKGKRHPTLDQFKAKTGITVNYYETINSNDQTFAKYQRQLSQGDGIGRDILVATDNSQFPELYVSQEFVQKLDKDLIPNVSNLIPAQASPPFDPNREYTLPWFSGMDGIAWNEKVTEPITTVTQLLTDPKLKGRVGVWNSMGDTLGLIMLENGDDPSKVTDETFDRAIAVVQKAQDAGQIRRFYGNDYTQPLAKGDLAASMAWSGDIFLLADPNVKWGMAKAGGIIWTDNMLIPLGGSVPTASTFMNFVYDPKIAAQLALGAGYISSVAGVKDEAAKLNPDAADNTLVFPTEDMLGQLHQNDPTMFSNPDYEKKWLAVQGK